MKRQKESGNVLQRWHLSNREWLEDGGELIQLRITKRNSKMPKKKISNNTKEKESISYTNEMPVHRPSINKTKKIKN